MSVTKRNLDSSLDTLAQSGTAPKDLEPQNNICKLIGQGSTKDSIKKRPKKKYITQSLSLAMIDVAKNNNEMDWVQRYWNTWHCQNNLITYDGKSYGDFCKNRWCLICLAIRKADMINRYKPELIKWKEPHFLTLTVKAQPNANLKKWMDGMLKAFKTILERCKKRHQRKKGIKLIGIRSLECNYNPIKKTYNPHFHVLTASKEIAETIKKEWIELWNRGPKTLALHYLQTIRKVRNTEKDLVETIKYGAKLFTDPTMKKGKNKSVKPKIYAAALHEIYKVFYKRHLFSSFGFSLPKTKKVNVWKEASKGIKRWIYEPKINDWVDKESGQLMTNYIPKHNLDHLLKECIDLEMI